MIAVACGSVYAAPQMVQPMYTPAPVTTPEQDQAQQDRLDKLADQQAEREKKARHDAAEQAKQDKADQLEQADQARKAQADRDAAAQRSQPQQPAQLR